MDIVIVGIDLGKNSCSLAGLDATGRVVLRRRLRREFLRLSSQSSGVALWRWKPVAGRTISGGFLQPRGMKFD